jgi:3-dehydrosphinganine reductase
MKSNNNYWQHKIVLITGGSSGIGLAVARLLGAKGAHVWILARNVAELESAKGLINCIKKQPCGVISADVSDWEQVNAAITKVQQKDGLPDVVINSAGEVRPGYFQDLDLDVFPWMMNTNYYGTLHVCKAVVPGMIARGSGHIVNISSMGGLVGAFGYTAYGASKFAVTGFTEALRSELKPLGVKVSIVFPPDTDTPQLEYENQYKPPETKAISSNAGIKTADEVASEIVHQVERGRYTIMPGFESKIWYWISRFLGSNRNYVMDWMVARAQRQNQRGE